MPWKCSNHSSRTSQRVSFNFSKLQGRKTNAIRAYGVMNTSTQFAWWVSSRPPCWATLLVTLQRNYTRQTHKNARTRHFFPAYKEYYCKQCARTGLMFQFVITEAFREYKLSLFKFISARNEVERKAVFVYFYFTGWKGLSASLDIIFSLYES